MVSHDLQVFGLRHFGTNYCLLQLSTPFSGFWLATRLAGFVYQRKLRQHGDAHETCIGTDCYR